MCSVVDADVCAQCVWLPENEAKFKLGSARGQTYLPRKTDFDNNRQA